MRSQASLSWGRRYNCRIKSRLEPHRIPGWSRALAYVAYFVQIEFDLQGFDHIQKGKLLMGKGLPTGCQALGI